MTLIEQLRTHIAPDDNYEDRDTIRDLMIAGADRIATLEEALREAIKDSDVDLWPKYGHLLGSSLENEGGK